MALNLQAFEKMTQKTSRRRLNLSAFGIQEKDSVGTIPSTPMSSGLSVFGGQTTTPQTTPIGTLDVIRPFGQAIARGWAATGARVAEQHGLTKDDVVDPKTYFGTSPFGKQAAEALFGTSEPFNATSEDIDFIQAFAPEGVEIKEEDIALNAGVITLMLSALDLTGAGGLERGLAGAIKAVRTVKTTEEALGVAKALRLSDDIAKQYADVFVKAKTADEAKDALEAAARLQETTRPIEDVSGIPKDLQNLLQEVDIPKVKVPGIKITSEPPTIAQINVLKKQVDSLAGKTREVIKSEIEPLTLQASFLEDVIEASTIQKVIKYFGNKSPEDYTLAQIQATGELRRTKAAKLDDVVKSLGYEDLDKAQEALERYIKARDELKALKEDIAELRREGALVSKAKEASRVGVKQRRLQLRALEERWQLNPSDIRSILRGRNISAFEASEWENFLKTADKKGEEIQKTREARIQLEGTIFEKELVKTENLRKALGYPSISKMTAQQMREFDEVLSQFKQGDEFFTVRQLEVVENTDLKGIKTVREAKERLLEEINTMREVNGQKLVTINELSGISVAELDRYRYDIALARRNPFYQLMVEEKTKAFLNANANFIEIRDKTDELLKAARKSRPRTLLEKAIPTDQKIFEWLEADDVKKLELAKGMTEAELEAAHYIRGLYQEARDYLMQHRILKHYQSDYITHIRRGFLEAWKEDGLMKAFKEAFDQYKIDEAVFNILDQQTGEILPLEKFFRFSMRRSGQLEPSKNVARAIESYIGALEKKKALDALVPKIDIYAHSLTPRKLTPRGLEFDTSLKRFVKEWLNTKKGRPAHMMVRPGGKLDWAMRTGVAFTRLIDLGFSIPIGIATSFGEQAADFVALGTKNYMKGVARLATKNGKEIAKKYENFVGEPTLARITRASNNLNDKFVASAYALFHAGTRKANQVFLLGTMTDEEFVRGAILVERLSKIQAQKAKYRVVPDMESVFGKTAEGSVAAQYRKWAVPLFSATMRNIAQLTRIIKNKGIQDALQKQEAVELLRSIILVSTIGFGTYGYLESEKRISEMNFLEEVMYKSARDALSLIGAIEPSLFTSEPRLLQFIADLGDSMSQIIRFEQNKAGDLTGATRLRKILTPAPVRQFERSRVQNEGVGVEIPSITIPSVEIPSIKIPSISI